MSREERMGALTAEEFGRIEMGMCFHLDGQVCEVKFISEPSSSFGRELALWNQRTGIQEVSESQCAALSPADARTAEMLRGKEAKTYGSESAPLTIEEARRMPNGANVYVRSASVPSISALWIGCNPMVKHYCFVMEGGHCHPCSLDRIRPADLEAAIACGREPEPGGEREWTEFTGTVEEMGIRYGYIESAKDLPLGLGGKRVEVRIRELPALNREGEGRGA